LGFLSLWNTSRFFRQFLHRVCVSRVGFSDSFINVFPNASRFFRQLWFLSVLYGTRVGKTDTWNTESVLIFRPRVGFSDDLNERSVPMRITSRFFRQSKCWYYPISESVFPTVWNAESEFPTPGTHRHCILSLLLCFTSRIFRQFNQWGCGTHCRIFRQFYNADAAHESEIPYRNRRIELELIVGRFAPSNRVLILGAHKDCYEGRDDNGR